MGPQSSRTSHSSGFLILPIDLNAIITSRSSLSPSPANRGHPPRLPPSAPDPIECAPPPPSIPRAPCARPRSKLLTSTPTEEKLLTMSTPIFWSTPLKYCRWAARERPALFWSVVIGATGPALMPIVPPIRYYFGDIDPKPVPTTYPVPSGPRKQLSGYDD